MKIFYVKSVLSFIILISFHSLKAQINLAPSATTSTSTSGGTPYQWNLINDNNISGCGNQEAFVWTNSPPNSTDQMTWSWSSAKSINKIVFHNSWNNTRNMTGCTVQYWNGSTYTNWFVSATNAIAQACVDSIKFPTITTTSIRLIDIKMTASGQTSNPSWREIQIISGPSVNVDMGVSQLMPIDICTNTQSVSIRAFNYGKKVADSFRLYWTVNGTAQSPVRYVTSKLSSTKDTLIVLNPSFTFTNNTIYNFKFWTSRPNGTIDSVAANDTLKTTLNFLGNPNPPGTTDFKQCGTGRPLLTSIPSSTGDSILWYNQSTGGTLLGIGKNFLASSINKTTTFYAQAMRFGGPQALNNGFSGTSYYGFPYSGGMFNVTPSTLIVLDSITFRTVNNLSTTTGEIYYKTGTFAGSEANAGAWTLLNSGTGRNFRIGAINYCRMSAKQLVLNGAQIYGFYVTTSPTGGTNYAYAKPGSVTVSNSKMTISAGTLIAGQFTSGGGQATNYSLDVEFSSKDACSNPTRSALKVTVNPRPIGAGIVKGAIYKGQYRQGISSQPDITAPTQTVSYEFTPPTGYSNSGHGGSWIVISVVGRTKAGYPVSSSEYTFSNPSGSTNGKLSFTPTAALCDSVVTFSIKYQDLGPYFCDSTITRTIKVAPTPKTSFSFPSPVCDGNDIVFNNLTTIGCAGSNNGFGNYKWYFGDGDSADLQNPVHLYKTYGCYSVKLVAISSPWGIVKDTTILVCVTEVPTVKFKVINACAGTAVKFLNQTTIGSGTLNYTWIYGDKTPNGSSANPSHLYASAGGYRVTLKVSANGCESSLTKNAYQFAKPVSNFTNVTTPVCANTAITFPNSTTIDLGEEGSYWTYGDGKSSTLRNGYNSYRTPGTYDVKLRSVSEFGCTDSMSKTVVIKPGPVPAFITNKLCSGEPTRFTNTTFEGNLTGTVYTWTLSDNSTYGSKDFTKNWPNDGKYTVTLKADFTNGCSGTTSREVGVLIQPSSDFTVKDICSGEVANYVNLTKGDRGNIDYKWDLGNGTSTDASPKRLYNPAVTTTYTVSLMASYNAGCADTTTRTITVSQAPTCDFTSQHQGYLKYQFTPSNTTYTKYEWFFGEGGNSFISSPNYQYAYAGGFKVRMVATNAAGCQCEVTKSVSATTSVNNVSSTTGLNIYPNPNTGVFAIKSNGSNGMKVEVYNLLGSKILSHSSLENTVNISLGDVSKGIYLVKVTIDGATTTTKVTVTD